MCALVPSLGGAGAPPHTTWACGPLSLLAWQQRAGDLSTCTSTVLLPLIYFLLLLGPTPLVEVGDRADERKAFLGMGFTFMTASAFTLAKTMRDLQEANSVKHLVDAGIIKTGRPPLAYLLAQFYGCFSSPRPPCFDCAEGGPEVGETIVSSIGGSAGWVLHSWLAFGASISLTAWGLLNLPIADERKVFLATSGLLLLTSTMNLVKVNFHVPSPAATQNMVS